MNKYYHYRQLVNSEIQKIPKKNKHKFAVDYLHLIQLAQKDDYENFKLERD